MVRKRLQKECGVVRSRKAAIDANDLGAEIFLQSVESVCRKCNCWQA